MRTQVLVNGIWMGSLGFVGGLKWSHVADGGCEEASWTMALSRRWNHPTVRTGALVEQRLGPWPVWAGVLTEPRQSEDGWAFQATGLAQIARDYLCFDGSLNTTSIPNTAIDQAIARGLNVYGVTRASDFGATAFGEADATDALNRLGPLLDAVALEGSQRWGVDARRRLYRATEPTTPSYYLIGMPGRLGLADDDYASNIYLRYRSGVATYATATATDADAAAAYRREHPIDATDMGVMNSTKAGNLVAGELAKGRALFAQTDAVNPSGFQLVRPGGGGASLRTIAAGGMAGLMVRRFGVTDQQGRPLPYLDYVVGKTEYEDGAATIMLSAVNLAARTLGDKLTRDAA